VTTSILHIQINALTLYRP